MSESDDTKKADDRALNLIIDEQRRDYDYLLKIYDRAGAKENALLAAGYAVLIYLYASQPEGTGTLAERLFFPTEDYGRIIYLIAAGFFFYGLVRLTLNVFGDNIWETAYESNKKEYSDDPLVTAEYVKGRYDKAHEINLKSYITRKYQLRLCFYMLLISAIILIVIKTLT